MGITLQNGSAGAECGKLFQVVQNTYFPTWVHGRHWKLELVDVEHPEMFGGCHGRCVKKEKTIFLNGRIVQALHFDDLEALIIHQTTHAITGWGHDEIFLRRLNNAADKAKILGKTTIFQQLSLEEQFYRSQARRVFCRELYDQIHEHVTVDGYQGSFENLLRHIGRMNATPVTDILSRCTKCESIFKKAERRVEMENKVAAKFRIALEAQGRQR
ncbi:MAG: hypothetical protein ABSG91_07590 [Syntrophobacteraceae bacterium]|jgi:uncharacterized protein with PIN domain